MKVKQVDRIRFLGVIIDDKLTWDAQIEHLENKLISTIVLIKHIKKFIPSSPGACTGFLKGVGEESARSAGFEATAIAASRGPGAQPPENF